MVGDSDSVELVTQSRLFQNIFRRVYIEVVGLEIDVLSGNFGPSLEMSLASHRYVPCYIAP